MEAGWGFAILCAVFALIGWIKAKIKENKRKEAVTEVLRPLLDKYFGQYEYDPNGFFTGPDAQGIVWADPGGRDLVSVRYKETGVRFCVMNFTSEMESDDDFHTKYRVDRFWGPWIIVEKENFINNSVFVGPKKSVKRKERVLTDDEEFDSFLAARGDSTEVMKVLNTSARGKIVALMRRHPRVEMMFESDKIKVSYGVGEYFSPSSGRKTPYIYEEQLKDLLDIIDTLIDL